MSFSIHPAFLALALVTGLILLYPALRPRPRPTDRVDAEIGLCRAQLAEVARDLKLGLIDAEAARAAEIEIKRRILALDRLRAEMAEPWQPGRRWAVAGVALMIPVVGFALYASLGRPDLPDLPLAARDRESERRLADFHGGIKALPAVADMVARLEARLAQQPDDLEGWLMLARSSTVLGRWDAAIQAYERARALAPDRPGIEAAIGELLVMQAEGVVSPAARRAFEAELARHPNDPRARFYLGLAHEQAGDFETALDHYLALARVSTADAPWLRQLRERIDAIARELGRDPQALLAQTARSDAPPGDAAALRARLAQNPKDWRGWIRLAELEAAAGKMAQAREALARARDFYTNAPFVLQQIEQAAAALGLAGEGGAVAQGGPTAAELEAARAMSPAEQRALIEGMVQRLATRLQEQPDDLEGWRMLARSYRVLGRYDEAVAAYRHLARKLPEDPEAQLDYALALVEAAGADGSISLEAEAVFERVLALAPGEPEALFYLGLAAAKRGDIARARQLWTDLLERLPPDTPAHAEIARRLRELGS